MRTAILAFCYFIVGCGTWIGNPGTSGKTNPKPAMVPKIDFAVPAPAGVALVGDPDNLLTGWVTRINDDIAKLNADVDRMNSDHRFDEAGIFSGKGPGGRESGTLSNINDGTYEFEAVVCTDGKVSTITKWSADGKHVASERNMNEKPDNPENIRVKMIYSEDSSKALTIQFYGTPKGKPADAEGDQVASWDEAKQLADGFYTVRGTRDWFNSGEALMADEYLTGKLSPAGAGEYVGWTSRAKKNCADTPAFSESDPTSMWCHSRAIGTGVWYTKAEAATAWTERLKSVGVAPQTNLGMPAVAATCPQ